MTHIIIHYWYGYLSYVCVRVNTDTPCTLYFLVSALHALDEYRASSVIKDAL